MPNPFSGFASIDAVTFRINDIKLLKDKIHEYKVGLECSRIWRRIHWGTNSVPRAMAQISGRRRAKGAVPLCAQGWRSNPPGGALLTQ